MNVFCLAPLEGSEVRHCCACLEKAADKATPFIYIGGSHGSHTFEGVSHSNPTWRTVEYIANLERWAPGGRSRPEYVAGHSSEPPKILS